MNATEKIDKLIKQQNMSRRQLAIKAGIPPTTLQSAMERGKIPKSDTLAKIADALGVPVGALVGDEEISNFEAGIVYATAKAKLNSATDKFEIFAFTDNLADDFEVKLNTFSIALKRSDWEDFSFDGNSYRFDKGLIDRHNSIITRFYNLKMGMSLALCEGDEYPDDSGDKLQALWKEWCLLLLEYQKDTDAELRYWFDTLNEEGQRKAIESVRRIAAQPQYQKEGAPNGIDKENDN